MEIKKILFYISLVGLVLSVIIHFSTPTSTPTFNSYALNPQCLNLSLFDSAACLRDNFIRPVYNGTGGRPNIQINLPDSVENEGPCFYYSYYYWTLLKERGFENVEVMTLYTDRRVVVDGQNYSINHMYIRAYDENGYCILDILTVVCIGVQTEKHLNK